MRTQVSGCKLNGLTVKDVADADVMMMSGESVAPSIRRAEHKFQKKASKKNQVNARIYAKAGISPYEVVDHVTLSHFAHVGKRGGLVRQ
jgi:hypothetical protein